MEEDEKIWNFKHKKTLRRIKFLIVVVYSQSTQHSEFLYIIKTDQRKIKIQSNRNNSTIKLHNPKILSLYTIRQKHFLYNPVY
jgi:hypothetical protein